MARKVRSEKVIQSSMRLPVDLWKAINRIAERKRLSMAQAVVQAVAEYVEREGRN